ncbi:VOC family protein [Micromonospora sp. NPDC050686]|uniref:VOC family protein n=1 Tax=Micromonospora sp. NPDC050686 TaxID=3154631 RepID=UPI0033E2818B
MEQPLTSPFPAGAELVTNDLDAARSFYHDLLGWTYTDTADGFTASADGLPAAELRSGPAPARWWTVFGTAGAAAVRAAAGQAGARLTADEVHDPLGGSFRLRTGVRATVPGPGRPCWYEYMTNDPARADRFHSDALDLRATTPPGASDDSYALLSAGGTRPLAGRLAMPAPLQTLLPAGWMVYLAVADPDDIAERAQRQGGRLLVPPRDVVTGRVCALADPAGAVFTVIRPAPAGG